MVSLLSIKHLFFYHLTIPKATIMRHFKNELKYRPKVYVDQTNRFKERKFESKRPNSHSHDP